MSIRVFWDASALVPLFAMQPPHTGKSRDLFNLYRVSAWWGTKVEIAGALSRLHRSGHLAEVNFLDAKRSLRLMAADWLVVEPSLTIENLACEILEKYPLRAADAFQLAAAMEWCEGRPNGKVFLTADRRLSEAAGLVGFTLEPGLAPAVP